MVCSVVGLSALLSACDLSVGPELDLCLDGPCGSRGPTRELVILGFPPERVDRSAPLPQGGFQGELRVGESATLYLVGAPAGRLVDVPLDTIRTAAWAVTNPSVARIDRGADGRGVLVGLAPGTVVVTADGQRRIAWACRATECAAVSDVAVLP